MDTIKEDHYNTGLRNEFDFVTFLHGKQIKDLDERWTGFFKKMFGDPHPNFYIKARKSPIGNGKTDIIICVKGVSKKISIKTGRNPEVHCEHIRSFLTFLEENGVSRNTLATIYLYHYGRTEKISKNGKPFSRVEILDKFGRYIKQANQELNSNDELLIKIINRTIFDGLVEGDDAKADFFYYGTPEEGNLYSKEEVIDIILKDKSDNKRGIHFGGLIYQPQARKLDAVNGIDHCKIKWPLITVLFYDNNPDKYINMNYMRGFAEEDDDVYQITDSTNKLVNEVPISPVSTVVEEPNDTEKEKNKEDEFNAFMNRYKTREDDYQERKENPLKERLKSFFTKKFSAFDTLYYVIIISALLVIFISLIKY